MKSSYILYKMISLEIKSYSYFKLSVHASTSESEGLDLNLCPSSQFPEFASSASNSPLCPNPDEEDFFHFILPPLHLNFLFILKL